ncbi:DNA-directed DNA/RNA polymerase mu-like isoform X2 [Macrobrachium rosenbergii]|uniref:DNA-directed DNA/RNA polymerase mu-like isoform X2 n=1 Tax=Macrobrachium rosenbergii TaxID=79674 RepID=UPI0034D70A32
MSQFAKKCRTDNDLSSENQDGTEQGNVQGTKLYKEEDRQVHKHKETKDVTAACAPAGASTNANDSRLASATIFLVPEGIQSKRYQLLRGFAIKNGFDCQEVICDRQKSLVSEENFLLPGYMLWLASRKKSVLETYTPAMQGNPSEVAKFSKEAFNTNILERNAPLNHCNPKLVEPLAFLNEYWTVMGDERRALAYAKAAATIKCLPFTVKSISEVDDLKGLGSGHGLKVIQEVLETGSCEEVIVKKDSQKFQILKNLSTVYGIGPSLALKLHTIHNINSVEDLMRHWSQISLADERIKIGVTYHSNLNTPVTLDIAKKIMELVNIELCKIKEGFVLELAGGFRRGKTIGHDIDLLISYKKTADEVGVLPRLMKQLNLAGYILHSRFEKSSYDEIMFKKSNQQLSTMDHFEKCFCIFKYPCKGPRLLEGNNSPKETDLKIECESMSTAGDAEQLWQAVRVDLVVIPKQQWAYGLLGWTGSKLFMRMLRHYSNKILQKTLNSHGLWDSKEMKLLPAQTEEDIFRHLQLSYKNPLLRNF